MPTYGIVFDLQRFSIHDGPGIRTVVFFKGCPLRCRWCQNPEGLDPQREISFSGDRCLGCQECLRVCPLQAINSEGAKRIRRELCDRCAMCVDACSSGALEVVGRSYTPEDLLVQAMDDMPFFAASGGGITLSGGEPTHQAEFLRSFLPLCKEAGLHVVLETCGCVGYDRIESLLPLLDLVLYDIKAVEPALHRQLTGSDNGVIIENFAKLVRENPQKTRVRVPLVPGLTITETNLRDIARFLKEHSVLEVTLLTYHRMGEAKLEKLDCPLDPLHLTDTSDGDTAYALGVFMDMGIEAVVQS